jgi:hypothetical protein
LTRSPLDAVVQRLRRERKEEAREAVPETSTILDRMHVAQWLPWRRFVVETSWPPTVAAIEIGKRIAPPRIFGRDREKPFVGKSLGEGVFRFSQATSYKNALLPVVEVVVEPSHRDGARVRVAMRLNDFVAVFVAVWTIAAIVGALACLGYALWHWDAVGLLGFAVPLIGAWVVVFPFSLDAREAESQIRQIFAPAPGSPPPFDSAEPYR